MPLLVVSDHADRTESVREGPLLNRRVSHANLLLARDRHGEFGRLRYALTHGANLMLSVERGAWSVWGLVDV